MKLKHTRSAFHTRIAACVPDRDVQSAQKTKKDRYKDILLFHYNNSQSECNID